MASDSSLSDGGEVTVFVHIRNVVDRVDELQPGQRVQFEPRIDSRNGKPEARDVRLLDDDRRDTQPWSAENAQKRGGLGSALCFQTCDRPHAGGVGEFKTPDANDQARRHDDDRNAD